MPNVHPSVCIRMNSVIFQSIGLGKVPKDSAFSKVVHSIFSYRNFRIIFGGIAENSFPGKFYIFKFLHFNPFSGVKIVPDSEFLGFRSFGISGRPEFTEYPVNSVKNFIFFFKYFSNKGFRGCLIEFYAFRFIRIMVFRITAKIPNLPGYPGRNYFFSFW